jgi:hypothetical protein
MSMVQLPYPLRQIPGVVDRLNSSRALLKARQASDAIED